MIFITGPLYSGKRTFAQTLPGKRLSDVQVLAADAADLPALADKLAHEYDILIATEVGGGVVPMDVKQRADREAAGRLACLLAAVLCVGMAALGGWALVLAALAVLWRYHAVSRKQFGGITGDLAGWFLQKAELWMLAALCACQWGGLL